MTNAIASSTDQAASASDSYPVTPHNTDPLPVPVRAIRATTAGVIKLVTSSGAERTCAFLAGETRPIEATHIRQSGTTCTGIEGMV